ncbi:MAG: hypothetical protein JO125_14770 [Chloroflexi bacterium]|nr:hypothetical protein [Chloroflexota bacterium]
MMLYTRAGRVTTSFLFLDGEPLEFVLSATDTLSDQGRAYDAVRLATAQCGCSADVVELRTREVIAGFGVQYQRGVFSLGEVTEDTLEEAVIRLANVVLLFYGVSVGACPPHEGSEG